MAQENANRLHAALFVNTAKSGACSVRSSSGVDLASITHPTVGVFAFDLVDAIADEELAVGLSTGGGEGDTANAIARWDRGLSTDQRHFRVEIQSGVQDVDSSFAIIFWRVSQPKPPVPIP